MPRAGTEQPASDWYEWPISLPRPFPSLLLSLSFRRGEYLVDIRARGKSSCDSEPDMRHGGFLDDWAKCTVRIDDVGRRSPFSYAGFISRH